MPEEDFGGLMADLSRAASPPPWSEIKAQRVRRTRAVLRRGAVASLAVVAVGFVAAIGLDRPVHRPTTGASTLSSPVTPPGPTESPLVREPAVVADSVGFSVTGRVYALLHTCVSGCDDLVGSGEATLWRSTDTGHSWARRGVVNNLSGEETLLVGSDQDMWIADTIGGTAVVYTTVDGGNRWTRFPLGPAKLPTQPVAYASGTAWFAAGVSMWKATPGAAPQPVALPGGPAPIRVQSAVALTERRVIVEEFAPGDEPLWLTTYDGGTTWAAMASPCESRIVPGTVARAPDGTVFAGCPADSGDLLTVRTSVDDAATWRDAATVHTFGRRIYPVTATAGWITGPGADILHVNDGQHWTKVRDSSIFGGPVAFGARDATVAAFAFGPEGGIPQIYVTTDGGANWIPALLH